MNLVENLNAFLNGDPDEPAFEVGGEWRPRGEVVAAARAVQALLDQAGVARGAGIGLVARNRLAHVSALIGLMAARHTVVMLHAYQPPEALAGDIGRLGLSAILADEADWAHEVLRRAVAKAGALGISLDSTAPASARPVEGLERLGDGPFREPTPEVGIEMLTSGTTGSPKQAPITHATLQRAIDDAARMNRNARGAADPAPHLQFYPLGNISGVWGVIPAAAAGRRIVLMERFSLEEWVDAVRRHRPSQLSLPPPAIQMILKAGVPPRDLSSIEIVRCGSGKLDPELQAAFETTYGLRILAQYGATEFCGVTVGWTAEDHAQYAEEKRGSTGRAWPGVRLRVVDPQTGEELPAGELGLLEMQVSRVSDAWVRTNDLVRLDADGFLFVEGRADFVINRGGFKVAPETVAEVLRRHPSVGEAVVVGAPDPRLNEVPVAAVELRPDAEPVSEDELLRSMRDHLPPQAIPVRLFVVDALPKTSSMKVHVVRARDMVLDKLQETATPA